jgi:hypothetical protein
MKRLVVLFSMGLIVACASHRYSVNEPPEKKFGTFTTVEVLSFSTNVQGEAAEQLVDQLPLALIAQLQDTKLKGSERKMFSEVTRSTSEIENVLTITGTILSFEEGSRAKRYLIGLGAGKAYATVQCIFSDKSTGESIAVATFDGELSGGFFGGSSEGASEGVIKAIEDFLKENY